MIRVAVAVYRILLRLLPGSFRREFGAEATGVFETVVREAYESGGRRAMLRAVLGGWAGILRGVAEEGAAWVGEMRPQIVQFADLRGVGLDLKQATRGLRKRPGTAVTVIATIALAVGATTSVYSVVDGVLIRPLPYPNSDRLVRVWETRPDFRNSPRPSMRAQAERVDPQAPEYFEWQRSDTGFESLGAYVDASFVLRGAQGSEAMRGQEVTSGLFAALGVEPTIGRVLSPSDDLANAPRVVVLSEEFWRDHSGGRQDALGSDLNLGGTPHRVIGVMPAGFQAPNQAMFEALLPGGGPRLWTPLTEEARIGWKNVSVLGRLGPSMTLPVVGERLGGVQAGLMAGQDVGAPHRGIRVESLVDSVVGGVRSTLWFLLGAVGLVLFVATVNIANLLLALGLNRRPELAVRSALGAGSGRLVRSLFIESSLLAALGGVGGMILAWISLPLLLRLLPPTLPRQEMIGMSVPVMLCGLAVTGVTALVIGTVPAILAARAAPQESMRVAGRSSTAGRAARRIRGTLVVAEVALAFVLLIAAGLLGNSYARLWSVDRGFSTEGLAGMWVEPDAAIHQTGEDYARFIEQLRDRLDAIPGVVASAANNMPLTGLSSGTRFSLERPGAAPEEVQALLSVGLENYLDVMGIPIVEGRGFARSDAPDTPRVAVVNETMARAFWPNGNVVGARFTSEAGLEVEIVGVAADVRHQGLGAEVEPKVYLPAAQSARDTNEWILRVRGDVATALRQGREAVADVSPTTPVTRSLIVNEAIRTSVALPRFRTAFIVGLATLAAVLALLGVYGVLAFSVLLRTKEIGVRMALGAQQRTVVVDVVGSGLKLVSGGIAGGLVLAWIASDVLQRFLFDVTTRDVPTYAAIVLSLLMVGALAAYLPARRAAAVDPVQVLNAE